MYQVLWKSKKCKIKLLVMYVIAILKRITIIIAMIIIIKIITIITRKKKIVTNKTYQFNSIVNTKNLNNVLTIC